MDIRITPGLLRGTVAPPPSKSQAHRVLIAAALSEGFSVLRGLSQSQDILATAACLRAMGAHLEGAEAGTVRVHGLGSSISQRREPWLVKFDCGESGSTLRFLIPVALVVQGGGIFSGRGRLMERPQRPYFDIFAGKGIFCEQKDSSLTVRGELTPGEYRLPGNVSSQFVTGLLYALPLLDGDSQIVLTSPLESRGYVDMTLDALGRAEAREDGWLVPGGQKYRPCSMTVEADWSQAAFWYGAIALGSSLELEGLNAFSIQGDMKIVPCFLKLQGRGELELDVSGCPDLAPPLAAMAALRAGEVTRLTNAARLRMKESDRLSSVTRALNALGADVEEGPDFLAITGRVSLAGGAAVDCCSDHRIAMMAAVAATRCKAPVTLLGAECVQKSYPNFWEEYKRLGGKLDVI